MEKTYSFEAVARINNRTGLNNCAMEFPRNQEQL